MPDNPADVLHDELMEAADERYLGETPPGGGPRWLALDFDDALEAMCPSSDMTA